MSWCQLSSLRLFKAVLGVISPVVSAVALPRHSVIQVLQDTKGWILVWQA